MLLFLYNKQFWIRSWKFHFLLCLSQSATGKMTAPAVRSFNVFSKKMTLTWYLPVIFMFFAKTLFFISTANQFNSSYMRNKHILSVSIAESKHLHLQGLQDPLPPTRASLYPLAWSARPPLPPFPCKWTCAGRQKVSYIGRFLSLFEQFLNFCCVE